MVMTTSKAEEDIENILRYTAETWGERQLLAYQNRIADAFDRLLLSPEAGHFSADLPDTHRLFPFGSHVIVYRIIDQTIQVIRILNQRMSLARHV
jgi:toxin ParE1/3/4